MRIHIFEENTQLEFLKNISQKFNIPIDIGSTEIKTESLEVEKNTVKIMFNSGECIQEELLEELDKLMTSYTKIFDLNSYMVHTRKTEQLLVDSNNNPILTKKGKVQFKTIIDNIKSYPKDRIIYTFKKI